MEIFKQKIHTMSHKNFKALEQLLGCYFHQDWHDEFKNVDAALKAMIDSEPVESVVAGLKEIDELLLKLPAENGLKAITHDQLGCYFDPGRMNMTYREWFAYVREQLLQGITS